MIKLEQKQRYYLDLLAAALKEQPGDAWLLYHQAKTFWFLDDTDKAFDIFSKVSQLAKLPYLQAAAWNQMATLRINAGQYEEAKFLVEKSLSQVPNQSVGYLIQHDLCYHQHQYEEALIALQSVKTHLRDTSWSDVIAGDFYHHVGLVNYKTGCVYLAIGLEDKAVAIFEKGSVAHPDVMANENQSHRSDCLYALALYYTRKGEAGKARQYIGECLQIDEGWLQAQVLEEYLSAES